MYIYPDIVSHFSCTMCGTCCRRDWLVSVDEASYRRNAEWFGSRGKQEEFAQAFVVMEKQDSPGEFAYIAKGQEGRCWFLTEANLCRLHREAGHGHLDSVCQTFPRYPIETSRGLEVTLSFSCPAVLELVSRPAPLEIVRSEEPPLALLPGSAVAAVFPAQQSYNSPLRFYFELEHHFIDILQHRGLSLGDRIGMLQDTVQALVQRNDPGELGQELNRLVYANYERLDAAAVAKQEQHITAEILAEHFMVNLIFKKLFYLYGLERTADFFKQVWYRLEPVVQTNDGERLEPLKTLIIDIELCYNHNRKALLDKTKRTITA